MADEETSQPMIPKMLWPSKHGESKGEFWDRVERRGLRSKVTHARNLAQARYEKAGHPRGDALKLAWLVVQEEFPPPANFVPNTKKRGPKAKINPDASIGPAAAAAIEAAEETAAEEIIAELPQSIEFNIRDDAIWAYQNAKREKDINMRTCPGDGAMFLLDMAKRSPKDFMALLAKVAPSEVDGKKSISGPIDKIDGLLRQIAERDRGESEVAEGNLAGSGAG